MVTAGEGVDSDSLDKERCLVSYYTPQQLPETHDPKEKSTLPWVCAALVFGIVITISSVAEPSFKEVLGSALFGLAVLIPSAWWLYCNNKDKQALARVRRERETHAYLTSVLSPDDASVTRGMGAPPRYEPMQRHWIIVAVIAAVVFGTGAALSPSSTQETEPTTGGSNVTEFATCEDAWEQGKENIPRSSKYYDIHLDEDKDGVACEK